LFTQLVSVAPDSSTRSPLTPSYQVSRGRAGSCLTDLASSSVGVLTRVRVSRPAKPTSAADPKAPETDRLRRFRGCDPPLVVTAVLQLMFFPSERYFRVRFPGRTSGALFATVLLVPTVLVAPTILAARPEPRPVSPKVQRLALSGVDELALKTAPVPDLAVSGALAKRGANQPDPVVLTEPMATDHYRMLGVTWKEHTSAQVVVTARTRTDGQWTDWIELDPMADVPKGRSPNGRLATSPYWAGDSDGVQVRVDAIGVDKPTGVRVDLIEPGDSPADAAITDPATSGAAFASTDQPNIVTRAQWGADESLRDKHLDMGKTVKVAFVHHTAGTNNYGPNEGPAVVRGLYSYYINSLGYADIGYNFLVDRFGNMYEGRASSMTEPVRQAATGGFNSDTMAVAALGNFETRRASDALVRGIAHVLAFRLSSYHLDPYGTTTLRTEEGPSRFGVGDLVKFHVISGHRSAGYTACPGQRLYDRMGAIRRQTKEFMGSNLIEPTATPHAVRVGVAPAVTVESGVLQQQSWTLTISRLCDGTVVRRFSGIARPKKPINVVWGGHTDAGKVAPPGRYRLSLASSGNGSEAWPWSSVVALGVGSAAGPVSGTTLRRAAAGTYVPLKPAVIASSVTGQGMSRPVLLGAGSRVDVPVLGQGNVPSSGVSAVAISVGASCASAATAVTVAPSGLDVAGARVVSVDRGGTAGGFSLMRLGQDGGLTFRNQSGSVALDVSVVGYVSTSGGGGSLVPLGRTRLNGAKPLAVSTAAVDVPVAGRAGVPTDARAVVLNVRRSGNSKVTSLWGWAAGSAQPGPSSWNRGSGAAAAQRVIIPLGDLGAIRVAADRVGQVALDVVGYVAADDLRKVHPVVPQRLTRKGLRLHRGASTTVSVRGRAGIPAVARAALIQLTGLNASASASLTVWPRGDARPSPVDLFVPKRLDRDGFALVPIGRAGDIRVHVAGGKVGVQVVVLGWVS
jgi:hypothetical protein